jgi:hypothetical protein
MTDIQIMGEAQAPEKAISRRVPQPSRDDLKQQQVPSTQRIFDAVCELHALEQAATRETVAELTGLKLAIIDDRLGFLANEGRVKRVLRGLYVPVEQHPPARPMSKTILPDGMVKIEVGDQVLELTPREDRTLAMLQAGAATQAAALETGRQLVARSTEMELVLSQVERATRLFARGSFANDPGDKG